MTFNLLNKDIQNVQCQTLVVFSKASSQKDKEAKITHADLNKRLAESLKEKTITGAHLESITFRDIDFAGTRHVIVIGLGKDADLNHEGVRQAFAAAFQAAKALNTTEVALHFDGVSSAKTDAADYMKAAVEGLSLASYVFDELKSKKSEAKEITFHIVSKHGDKSVKAAFGEAIILGQCVNFSRRLGDMPGNNR